MRKFLFGFFGILFLINITGIIFGFIDWEIFDSGLRITRNFYEVDPQKFYRSAQLNKSELNQIIEKYKIRTVINLQGERANTDWYNDEKQLLEEKNIPLINIEMAVQSIPKRFELIKLLDAYRDRARPLLVHCRSGTDRTGEATAIYQMEYMGFSKEQALKSFSLKYMYVEALAPSKLYFVENYVNTKWAYTQYDHCLRHWKFSDWRECPPQP